MSNTLISVKGVVKYFPIKTGILREITGWVHAVDDVSFDIKRGETLGLIGESGCGKTTLGRTILRLIEPTEGEVYFKGRNIFRLNKEELREMRRYMQIIFQDPFGSFNPRLTVKKIIGEPLKIQGVAKKEELNSRVLDLLDAVGLEPDHLNRYIHEFSGGQRQRIGIGRALALNPDFIVLDEPTSALDVSVQAKILNLLQDLKEDLKLTYLFISHNLAVVNYLSDKIAVMYLGKIVELGPARDLFVDSLHPYTKALISAIPTPDPEVMYKRIVLKGEVQSAINIPSGCRFQSRCPEMKTICQTEEPGLIEVKPHHFVACHSFN